MVNLGNDWDEILKDEFQKDYYRNLRKFLADEYRKCVVYPNMYDIFNALRYTSFENTRAVILGQDPYHGPSARALLLRFERHRPAAVPEKYFSGTFRRCRVHSPASRRAYRVGKARRADVEFGSHGA